MNKKKNKGIRIRYILILFFVIYVCTTMVSQQKKISELKAQEVKKGEEIKKLEEEVNELDKEIKNSDSLEFVEKAAREELKMVKPREIIYVDKNNNKDPFLNK